MELVLGGIYKHFKGDMYVAIDVAYDSETKKEMVIYLPLNSDKLWVRNKEMFLSKVDKKKYPDVKQEYRFEFIKMYEEPHCGCGHDCACDDEEGCICK